MKESLECLNFPAKKKQGNHQDFDEIAVTCAVRGVIINGVVDHWIP